MRGKRAKQLRRVAENMTVGKPHTHYVVGNNQNSRTVELHPECTKKVYRILKIGYKKGFNV